MSCGKAVMALSAPLFSTYSAKKTSPLVVARRSASSPYLDNSRLASSRDSLCSVGALCITYTHRMCLLGSVAVVVLVLVLVFDAEVG